MLNYRHDAAASAAELDSRRGSHMRKTAIAAGIALLCAAASQAPAADMATKASKKVAAVEPVCLRWVQQNYSWYNYCDPVPYYPRNTRYWWGF